MRNLYYHGKALCKKLTVNDYVELDGIKDKFVCMKKLIPYYEEIVFDDCDALDKENLFYIFYFICLSEPNNSINPKRGQVSREILSMLDRKTMSLVEALALYKGNLAYL